MRSAQRFSGRVVFARRDSLRRSRKGYALLGVLLLIALAGMAMVSASRHALDRVMEARQAELDLQRRWAVLSTQAALLPRAEALLAYTRGTTGGVEPSARLRFRLNGDEVSVTVRDEQANANVNALLGRGAQGERALRELVYSAGAAAVIEPRPAIPPLGSNRSAFRAYGSFAHVFPHTPPAELFGRTPSPSPVANVTCFGTGLLNFRRATPQSFRAICSPYLDDSQIERLVDLRTQLPAVGLTELLDRLQLPRERRQRVEPMLTDSSSCHSVWIVMKRTGGSWYHLAVREAGAQRLATFTW